MHVLSHRTTTFDRESRGAAFGRTTSSQCPRYRAIMSSSPSPRSAAFGRTASSCPRHQTAAARPSAAPHHHVFVIKPQRRGLFLAPGRVELMHARRRQPATEPRLIDTGNAQRNRRGAYGARGHAGRQRATQAFRSGADNGAKRRIGTHLFTIRSTRCRVYRSRRARFSMHRLRGAIRSA